jgi:hypothetical protein
MVEFQITETHRRNTLKRLKKAAFQTLLNYGPRRERNVARLIVR